MTKKYKIKVNKPFIGYPGSTIQQSHGESIKKGYLVWDIEGKNKWNVEWKQLVNLSPFVTIEWKGTVEKTIEDYANLHGSYAFMPGTRFRVVSKEIIHQAQTRNLVKILVDEHSAESVTFKTDSISRMDHINAIGINIAKKSLAQDPDAVFGLYKKYVEAHNDAFDLSNIDYSEAKVTIEDYLSKLTKKIGVDNSRGVTWSIKSLKFDNLFGYGEKNYIDFSSHSEVVGILGNNRIGKSSIIGSILYVLFNTTDRGSIKNNHIINDLKNHCYGEVRISVGTDDYVIERRSNRVKKLGKPDTSTTSVNLWKMENDGYNEKKVSHNGISRDETDSFIRNLIGTSEDFLLTAFASQGRLNKFIDNKATKRKEYLNRFLELDVFNKLYMFAYEDYSKLNNLNGSYSIDKWKFDYEQALKKMEKSSLGIKSHDESISALSNKRDAVKLWLNEQDQKASGVENSTIQSLESYISKTEKEILEFEERLVKNKERLREDKKSLNLTKMKMSKIDIELLKSENDTMSSLFAANSELEKTFDDENRSLLTQENSISKLKVVPCGNSFPSCHFIKDGHLAKTTIKDQKRLVRDLNKNLREAKKLFEKYEKRNISDKMELHSKLATSIAILEAKIPSIESSIEHDSLSVQTKKTELRTSKSKLNKAKKAIKMLGGDEYTKKQGQLKDIENNISKETASKDELLIIYGSCKHKIEKLEEEKSHNKDLLKKLNLFNSIQSAFSKNGIPAMVLMSQLPAINKELAKILDSVVDFTITLETDTDSNVMDIYIEDGKSRRLIELGSGMEKTICSMALRVALGNLSSLSRPDVFILDESFGALDEENLTKGMDLLTIFSGYFKAIYIITHIPQIKEITNKIIEIKNNGIESTVRA